LVVILSQLCTLTHALVAHADAVRTQVLRFGGGALELRVSAAVRASGDASKRRFHVMFDAGEAQLLLAPALPLRMRYPAAVFTLLGESAKGCA
jgi:hypothetical protein